MEKYKFKIDNEVQEWDKPFITGAEIRAIPPGIPSTMDLFIKYPGKPGELVENDKVINLSEPGIEKFYTQASQSTPGF